ncbi:hypothetical protein KM043_011541 [Ampulex compressa]|nr:hypothetical protein KM043_011541 [Ampulex compressa]
MALWVSSSKGVCTKRSEAACPREERGWSAGYKTEGMVSFMPPEPARSLRAVTQGCRTTNSARQPRGLGQQADVVDH